MKDKVRVTGSDIAEAAYKLFQKRGVTLTVLSEAGEWHEQNHDLSIQSAADHMANLGLEVIRDELAAWINVELDRRERRQAENTNGND